MAKSRYKNLIDKSVQAAIATIEVYNKPDFKYREETFSILMVNAWELLFKAKILLDNLGQMKSIYVSEKTKNSKGVRLKRFYPKKNRSGNALTLDIFSSISLLDIDGTLKENINLLVEIRDNAIHFMNDSKEFEKIVLEIGTASLKSYVTLVNEWFDYDLTKYNFYLMPMSFFHTYEMESFSISNKNKQKENFLAYVSNKINSYPTDLNKKHNIVLRLETKFEKSKSDYALSVRHSKDSPIVIKQEIENRIKEGLENGSLFSYEDFIVKLRKTIPNLKINDEFNRRKKLMKDKERYCSTLYLNPLKKSGTARHYWTTEAIKEMKKSYEK